MELLAVGVWGYKRFEEDNGNLDVTGNAIAIVGPNEVGKTTFLKALLHLEHDEGLDRNELTRQGNGKSAIRALYALDDEDRAAIVEVGGIGTPTTFTFYKREGGTRYTKLEPALERELAPREKVVAVIRRLFNSRWMKGNADDHLVERLTKLHDDLVGEEQSLDDEVIESMREVAADLEKSIDSPAAARRLIGQLTDLAKHEEAEHPNDAARDILSRRRPRFLWFDDDRRQVETPYNFGDTPSPALSNLLALVDLDLPKLRRAVQANDQTTAAEMVDAANRAFADLLTGRWRQANVQVHLHLERDSCTST